MTFHCGEMLEISPEREGEQLLFAINDTVALLQQIHNLMHYALSQIFDYWALELIRPEMIGADDSLSSQMRLLADEHL